MDDMSAVQQIPIRLTNVDELILFIKAFADYSGVKDTGKIASFWDRSRYSPLPVPAMN
jgi:hypothetical protein